MNDEKKTDRLVRPTGTRRDYGHKQATGRRGEDIAARYLNSIGHTIVERNWRCSHLEVDLITLIRNELHFVEVKSRTAPAAVEPERNVNRAKMRNLCNAAKSYLNSARRRGLPGDLEIIFDILTIVFDGPNFELEYYPHAFIPTYA